MSQTSHDILHAPPAHPSRPVDLVNEPLLHGGIPRSCHWQGAGAAGTTCYKIILHTQKGGGMRERRIEKSF